ncbi:MAG: hypothetical protein JWN48_1240 [Myxococcaceae bacterium]|nr:hypothetical protein [Myxococcaceae bacterium]
MTTTSNAATTGLPSNCIALPERALPDVSSDGGGLVIARPATDVGCASSDAGASYFTSVFRRRDGEPLTQQGELYSLRWTLGTLSQRVRAIVGETRDSCPDVVVLDGPTTLLSTCQEFTSPIESAQLLLYEDDFLAPLSLLNPMASQQLALCRGSCPPGTQPVVADAGVASDAGDAGGYGGYVTPAIPSVPSFP